MLADGCIPKALRIIEIWISLKNDSCRRLVSTTPFFYSESLSSIYQIVYLVDLPLHCYIESIYIMLKT